MLFLLDTFGFAYLMSTLWMCNFRTSPRSPSLFLVAVHVLEAGSNAHRPPPPPPQNPPTPPHPTPQQQPHNPPPHNSPPPTTSPLPPPPVYPHRRRLLKNRRGRCAAGSAVLVPQRGHEAMPGPGCVAEKVLGMRHTVDGCEIQTSHHLETMVETSVHWYLHGNQHSRVS